MENTALNASNSINASVYRDAGRGDCTNNGVTRTYHDVIVYWGNPALLTDSDREIPNLLVLRTKRVAGNDYLNLAPVALLSQWVMDGGNFAYSCDSRFRTNVSAYPVPVHDRKE